MLLELIAPAMIQNEVTALYRLIHEAQKERGLVSLFLADKNSEFADLMEMQFVFTDKMVGALPVLPKKKSAKIDPLLIALQYAPAKRRYITSRMISPEDATSFYTHDVINPAIDVLQELMVFESKYNPSRVSAFNNFMHWKERVGRQRALSGVLLINDRQHPLEIKTILEYIISKQQAYERMFLCLCDSETRAAITAIEGNSDVFRRIDALNQDLLRLPSQQWIENFDPKAWFDLFTEKMDILFDMGLTLIEKLSSESLPLTYALLKPEQQPSNDQAEIPFSLVNHFDQISDLPLFSCLDRSLLMDVLKFARVMTHEKGSLIFINGEPATRFYIVLSGWVKLFNGNSDGQEAILQLIGSGHALSESAIFNSSVYQVCAQATEEVQLLSIPTSIIKDKIKSNGQLAANMITTVAGRSESLMRQFEQLALHSVNERVGRFILKLMLEDNSQSVNFKLPHDKSLIAGFLGMKPETFSRVLQSFKDQGIEVGRNSVTLPSLYALCSYCDEELGSTCQRFGDRKCRLS
jgi:CRP-like cAMP-binding protein